MPAWGKDPSQAVADMQAVSDTDPNGFKWMIVCIGLLFLMAGSLIVATVVYGMKQKKLRPQTSQHREEAVSHSAEFDEESELTPSSDD